MMMKTIILVLVALAAVTVAVDAFTPVPEGVPDANGNVMLPPEPLWKIRHRRPAIMSAPTANLTKPIIYSWRLNETNHRHHHHLGVISGKPPAALKRVKVTRNLYGGKVEWERSRNPHTGCHCKRQVKRFRYDVELKNRKGKHKKHRCHCKKKKAKLPPVVAELYPKKHYKRHSKPWFNQKFGNTTGPLKYQAYWHGNGTHPGACKKKHHKKRMVAPEYKPERRHRKNHGFFHGREWHRLKNGTVVCKKDPKRHRVVPEFYPHRKSNSTHHRSNGDANKRARLRHRKNRPAGESEADRAARIAAAQARRDARKARRAAKRAARKARRAKKTPGPDTPVTPFTGGDPVEANPE